MQRLGVVFAPEFHRQAELVATRWVSATRVPVFAGDESEVEALLGPHGEGPDVSVDAIALILTEGVFDLPHVETAIERSRMHGLPVVGIDIASLLQPPGLAVRLTEKERSLLTRHYLWKLDNGASEIVEWFDYEISAAHG
jgi:hypothetical protein